ncbi:tripartite motif-containing protein 5 isoform X1 [Hylobates moloch]|nr:tripartite motif-containing protein 5 isoform X1 [Hylobates moloch]XP_032022687.1 tripartite motif-containing protein 5 isoform X1 [Hylobates moloch]XP_032022688.1 tripartite motif-containing protein 5 isoform X1 [Hylobates moloch]XP_032022689.1 tripartite motif-containing protein 5 isoform X1 [Hylobates moloch]XP_032022690.1 tripartite motif-containing protein 5 isoform X1 [Hylobates moloch]XP_032022691.1 tripartite motif-containing protein 5 isoform X1 [Hylobates moloch]XP_032022692.1 tr
MASGILVNVKEEVTCPICLELLTQPLSLDCGHSFCQACLTANHKTSMPDGERSCPVCRISYQHKNIRPNRHVANIVEKLREVKLSPEEGQKVDHCARHGEKLLLFCREDRKVICWLCERSQEHRGHHTFLMEEVAQEYQVKLQAALQMLRQKQQEAEQLEADIREEKASWKTQIQYDKTNILADFEQLRHILDWVESNELQNLEKEEKDVLKRLMKSEIEMVQQTQSVRELISDLEHRLQGSVMELLQGVDGVIKRMKNVTLKKPETFPKNKRRVFRAADLKVMLEVLRELRDVRRYWVDVTVAPNNISYAVISEDMRQVSSPEPQIIYEAQGTISQTFVNFNYCTGILGSQSITSGKHYWEVDVSKKSAWILGVCAGLQPDAMYNIEQNENYQPKYGYWVIGLEEGVKCNAFQDGSSHTPSAPFIVPLSVKICPDRVGVFLDYEACTVSFFNITNHGVLIYKFSHCSFSQPVFPYLNPRKCTVPMTLCSPSS